MRRRDVVFDRGRDWRAEDDRYRALHLGPDRGAAIGEYASRESSEYSDSYYGPGDDYERRTAPTAGYTEEQPDFEPRVAAAAGRSLRGASSGLEGNRAYGEVYSYGELRPGQASWADLGVHSVRPNRTGAGPFRGRGPKGYVRSDERLLEAISELLTDDPRIDASEICVEVRSGEVSLTGTVPDKATKWRAEELVDSLSGVKALTNSLRCSRT